MRTDPWQLLDAATTVLAVHAHPDDESLSTGALLSSLVSAGIRVELVTATRGEEGEVVPGSVAPGDARALELIREAEIDAATAALGLSARYMLGTAPALAPDAAPRQYRDSGMQWVRDGLAGPSDTAGPDSFTHRPLEDAVVDLVALLEHLQPDVVIGYDDEGTYGHPDHVHAHRVTAEACARTGVARLEVASAPESEGTGDVQGSTFVWRNHPDTADVVRRAVDSYRTQLTVIGGVEGHGGAGGDQRAGGDATAAEARDAADSSPADSGSADSRSSGSDSPDSRSSNSGSAVTDLRGVRIRHVGGQDDVVALRTGLRVGR